jgi:hypothetical protein
MIYPVGNDKQDFDNNWYVAQGFGAATSYGFHEGIDLNLKSGGDTDLGQPVKMIANGQIVYWHFSSHPTTGYGRHIVYRIDGPWGTRWVHSCHLQEVDFKNVNASLPEGAMIGRLGKSGNSPSAHLHFSIFKVDPAIAGIDNIANTQAELNATWEDPIAFMNAWMAPIVAPVTDQSLYDFGAGYGVMELQRAKSLLAEQKAMIVAQDTKLSAIRAIVV